MQAIMEPIFEIPYLIGVVVLGILIIRRAKGEKQFKIFGAMAIVLGCGDAFHLVPRMWALISQRIALFDYANTHAVSLELAAQFSTDITNLPGPAAALGFGKLVTSITMTVFYVMLFHVWMLRYDKKIWNPTFNKTNSNIRLAVYFAALFRIGLCLMPQNEWLSPNGPLAWGIVRNIPFLILGVIIVVIFFKEARKDKFFKWMWLAVTLSFLFYIPVVLFADAIPIIGMLMLPKTCAYVWIVVMGFRAAGKEREI